MTGPAHKRELWVALLLALVALLAHAPALANGATFEDDVQHPWLVRGGVGWSGALERAVSPDPDRPWSPPADVAVALCSRLGARGVAAAHAFALAAHAAAVLLLWRLAVALGWSRRASAMAALLFAVHPATAEPVAWISALGHELSTALALAALSLLALPGPRRAVAGALAAAAALLASPAAVAVLPLGALLAERGADRRAPRSVAAWLAGGLAAAWVAAAVAHGEPSAGFGEEIARRAAAGLAPLECARAAGAALLLLIAPDGADPFRSLALAPGAGRVAVELGALAAWVLAAAALRKRAPRAARPLAAALCAVLPLALAAPGVDFALADRYRLLALAPACLAAGQLLALLPALPGWLLALGLAVPLAAETRARTPLWRDATTALREAVRARPELPHAHWRLAGELLDEFRKRGDAALLHEAHAVTERGQDLLQLSKEPRSGIRVAEDDFRQINLMLGWSLLALAEVDADYDFETARAVFDMIAGADPLNAQAYLGAGLASFGAGDLAAAEASFQRALTADPASADAQHDLGRVEMARERWAAAEQRFRQALALRPTSLQDRLWLARAVLQQGDLERARREVERARELDPYHPEASVLRGIVELKRGSPREALSWIDRGLAAAPNDGFARLQRGHAFRALGELTDAMIELKRACDASPRSFEARYALGEVLLAMGERDVAAEQLAAAYDLAAPEVRARLRDALRESFGDHPRAQLLFAAVDRERGDEAHALEWLGAALALAPDDPGALQLRARIERGRGEPETALASLEAALEAQPDSFAIRRDLAVLLAELGRSEEAARHLERALELVPRVTRDPSVAEKLRGELRAAIDELRGE